MTQQVTLHGWSAFLPSLNPSFCLWCTHLWISTMYQATSYQGQGYDPNSYAPSPPHQKGHGGPGLQNSRSPPPLQHPVPQHPILNFRADAASPSPQMSHQQQPQGNMNYYPQQQQQPQQPPSGAYAPNNLYSQFGFNDPAAQMGMQFAGSAMAHGQAYVEQNVRNLDAF